MDHAVSASSLDAVRCALNPRAVAILGASDDTTIWGGSIMNMVRMF